ncbi:hypothetical protein BSKO_08976 [Bryopsis sp. KO-2023]|nr:hypothetical protein BSKO_08976 [Bryopsis sp. KO-2023]
MRFVALLSVVCVTLVAMAQSRCVRTGRRLAAGPALTLEPAETEPADDSGCERWVMIMTKTKYHRKGECWLKDANVKRARCIVCAGGVNPKPIPKEGCVNFPGVDFTGDNIHKRPRRTRSDDHCCDLCQKNKCCKAWTREKTGACWLKNAHDMIGICTNCTGSGIIKSRQSVSDMVNLQEVLGHSEDPEINATLKPVVETFLTAAEALKHGH